MHNVWIVAFSVSVYFNQVHGLLFVLARVWSSSSWWWWWWWLLPLLWMQTIFTINDTVERKNSARGERENKQSMIMVLSRKKLGKLLSYIFVLLQFPRIITKREVMPFVGLLILSTSSLSNGYYSVLIVPNDTIVVF